MVLGVQHILAGIDHLLFVLALLLVVRGGRRIVATITAFTLAHSLTLAAATLGWVHVPGPPVEAMIALSIVFVAAEIVRGLQGRPGLTARAPWVVAFASACCTASVSQVPWRRSAVPQTALPLALLMFNAGRAGLPRSARRSGAGAAARGAAVAAAASARGTASR